MSRAFLSTIRPAPFGFSKEESSTIAEEIVRLLNSNRNLSMETSVFSRNVCANDIVYRCGIPFESSFKCDQKALFWNNVYYSNVANVTEEHLTSFAVKRDMFHAFFGTLDESEMNIEYNDPQSTLPNLQTQETSTNQIISPQAVGLGMTQTSQVMSTIQREESSIEIPQSRIDVLSTLEMRSPIVPQQMLTASHVPESERDITMQSQNAELQITFPSSSQMNTLSNTPVPPPNEILTLSEAIAKYKEWEINPRNNMMMILVEYDERNTPRWHVWYVQRNDQERIMTILPSRATYYHADRSSNKRTRTIDTRQVCDGSVNSLIVPKNDYKSSINQFFDDHQGQAQNDELNHHKSTFTIFNDPRRHTTLGGSMAIANIPIITHTQEHSEEEL